MGIITREVISNGNLLYATIYTLIMLIKSLFTNTTFWSWEKSNFRNPNTGGFNWTNFFGALLYCIIIFTGGTLLLYTFQFALYGNMNQGIITSLFGLSSIFSAVMAYYLFGDKLKSFHVSLKCENIL